VAWQDQKTLGQQTTLSLQISTLYSWQHIAVVTQEEETKHKVESNHKFKIKNQKSNLYQKTKTKTKK